MIRALWDRWEARCFAPVDSRPLALVRILAASVIAVDLSMVLAEGLVPHLFRTYADGGLSQVQDAGLFADRLFADQTGPVLVGITLLCTILGALGLFSRPALLLGVLAYAQLGHLYPPGDRGVDRILRMALLVCAAAPTHRRWSLGPLWGDRRPALTMPAWPADLLRFALVLVYTSAGTAKLIAQPAWLALSGRPVLYRLLTDPLAGALDPSLDPAWFPLLRLGGYCTIALELSAPLLLTRLAPYWGLAAVAMHLGIAMTMKLGMFSWGMLALYPIVFAPWWRSQAQSPSSSPSPSGPSQSPGDR